jgi:hypothetical protein
VTGLDVGTFVAGLVVTVGTAAGGTTVDTVNTTGGAVAGKTGKGRGIDVVLGRMTLAASPEM